MHRLKTRILSDKAVSRPPGYVVIGDGANTAGVARRPSRIIASFVPEAMCGPRRRYATILPGPLSVILRPSRLADIGGGGPQ